MHSLLEKYLSEVSAHLSPLPTKRRNEELREMRNEVVMQEARTRFVRASPSHFP